MEPHYLQKQMDLLWNKVKSKVDDPRPDDFVSAFEQAQAEIQAESIQQLKSRFEKEKSYWENLLASKEEALERIQLELREELAKNHDLKSKIIELQETEGGIIEQSFATLELQKKSLNARIEHLEGELDGARRDFVALKFKFEEEENDYRKAIEEWKQKEDEWIAQRESLEAKINAVKQELIQQQQIQAEEATNLNRTIKEQQKAKKDQEELAAAEKKGLEDLLAEKTVQNQKISEELEHVRRQYDTEREERRLASVERERRAVQDEEDRKKMVEQLLVRERKIKELQDSLESLIKEHAQQKETLGRREQTIKMQEELLSKRREDWVDSVRSQASQQLNLSGKIIDLLGKVEEKTVGHADPFVEASIRRGPALPASLLSQKNQNAAPPRRGLWARFLEAGTGEKLLVASVLLITVSICGALFYFYGSEGRKAATAQKYLMRGNELYTNGALDESLKLLEKSYALDPQNYIIKNSYTLVLGEVAHRLFTSGQFEEALEKTEALNRIIPEDPDVIRLYNDILHAMGDKNRSKTSVIPSTPGGAPKEPENSEFPAAEESQPPKKVPEKEKVPAPETPATINEEL